MSDISTYLEAIKERFDLSSDYALAKKGYRGHLGLLS